jgi:hypothetical protein
MAFSILIKKLHETEHDAVFEFSDDSVGAGQLRLDKKSGEIKELVPAPKDATGRRFQRAALKIMQHWQRGELPLLTSWDS